MYQDRYVCPGCFLPTLQARAAYDACEICDWEEDGRDSDVVCGGPNGDYSLREARENYRQHLTMYRPADTHACAFEQMDRRIKEELVRNLTITTLTGSDEHWQQALMIEQELVAERTRQGGLSH